VSPIREGSFKYSFDKSLITGEVLASVIHILTSLEVDEGGPYKTWIVEDTADKIWQDVDLAVNANIGYFLALNKIDLPNITTFIENALKNSTYTSPYYPTPYPILYFISRWYSGELKEKAIDDILKNQGKDCWGNPINASCAVSTLLRFGYDPGKLSAAAQYISDSLEKPESHAFYTGINPKRDKTFFAGSPSLTITLSIEALSLYNEYMKLTQQSKPHPSPFAHLHKATLEFIDSRINKTSPEVQHVMTAYTNKLRKTDNDVKIILLPYLFYKSIHTQKKLPDDFFIKLGAANLYGWIAYTIYDDFLDEEGNPQHLPAANICLRELTSIFEKRTPKNPAVVSQTKGEVIEVKDKEGEARVIKVLSDVKADSLKSSSSEIEYIIPPYRIPVVKAGDKVVEGELLTDGSADISEVFKYGGKDKVEEYIIREINKVYELQSASISRKHTEIIVRQMFSRRRIKDAGETNFSVGDIVENTALIEENNRVSSLGNIEAKAETIVLGITEVSLRTKSWLSAASFQNTNRVLIENAVKGGVDSLRGLKENVIIGRLIPAGTGFRNKTEEVLEEVEENLN
jgi:DNA-directed RNA polymerase subunit beta'